MSRLTPTALKNITKKMFAAYRKVQMSGKTNMWDTRVVSMLSGYVLSPEDVLGIITHYDALSEKFPE